MLHARGERIRSRSVVVPLIFFGATIPHLYSPQNKKGGTHLGSFLEERFRIGDQRRNALMESARMLANRMEMEELFSPSDP